MHLGLRRGRLVVSRVEFGPASLDDWTVARIGETRVDQRWPFAGPAGLFARPDRVERLISGGRDLLEQFSYANLQFNVGLRDEEFNK